jgi:NAD(P)-dependent dehydrogenase (short-subunit alcohol dehydrogenase family)
MNPMQPLQEQVILITGATDGLGKLVATNLARQGACVLLHGRDASKGARVLDAIHKETGNTSLRYYNADLASLAEVKQLAVTILQQESRLDVLVNNAGIGPRSPGLPRRLSQDGHELMFAVNYLAGFLLSRSLLPLLKTSAPSRIVNVASVGQQALDFDNLMLDHDFDDARAYRQSKLAQILDTITLAEELAGTGVTVNCLHPATLMDTKMVHESSGYFPGVKTSTAQGAEALEYLITSAKLDAVSGCYYDGKTQARAQDQAYDAKARRRLVEISKALVLGVGADLRARPWFD